MAPEFRQSAAQHIEDANATFDEVAGIKEKAGRQKPMPESG
jgi:hypothetical protein